MRYEMKKELMSMMLTAAVSSAIAGSAETALNTVTIAIIIANFFFICYPP